MEQKKLIIACETQQIMDVFFEQLKGVKTDPNSSVAGIANVQFDLVAESASFVVLNLRTKQ